MQTRKYPRTLQEAFGPHTSREVLEKSGGYHLSDRIVLWGSWLASGGVDRASRHWSDPMTAHKHAGLSAPSSLQRGDDAPQARMPARHMGRLRHLGGRRLKMRTAL